jgi:lysophospholipase-2
MAPLTFPEPVVIEPESDHKGTIIMLHGRGSNGPDFAEELMESQSSSGIYIRDLLPSYKWLFPTAAMLYACAFQEVISQWYDIYSLTDPDAKPEIQLAGLKASIAYLQGMIRGEAQASPTGQVVVAGISQGFTIALLAALIDSTHVQALIGFSSWLPMRSEVRRIISESMGDGNSTKDEIRAVLAKKLEIPIESGSFSSQFPVFLAHCRDDGVVDFSLGCELRDFLIDLNHDLSWTETDTGDHWINEPRGVDGLENFMLRHKLTTEQHTS